MAPRDPEVSISLQINGFPLIATEFLLWLRPSPHVAKLPSGVPVPVAPISYLQSWRKSSRVNRPTAEVPTLLQRVEYKIPSLQCWPTHAPASHKRTANFSALSGWKACTALSAKGKANAALPGHNQLWAKLKAASAKHRKQLQCKVFTSQLYMSWWYLQTGMYGMHHNVRKGRNTPNFETRENNRNVPKRFKHKPADSTGYPWGPVAERMAAQAHSLLPLPMKVLQTTEIHLRCQPPRPVLPPPAFGRSPSKRVDLCCSLLVSTYLAVCSILFEKAIWQSTCFAQDPCMNTAQIS